MDAPNQDSYAVCAAFFLASHRDFIKADSFFRAAALMPLRPAVFLAAAFLAGLAATRLFCFAQRARCAAAILARASGLITRRFRAGANDTAFGGRPRLVERFWRNIETPLGVHP